MARLLPSQHNFLRALTTTFAAVSDERQRRLVEELAVIGLAEWDLDRQQARRTALGEAEVNPA